jgi:hypothetical protein
MCDGRQLWQVLVRKDISDLTNAINVGRSVCELPLSGRRRSPREDEAARAGRPHASPPHFKLTTAQTENCLIADCVEYKPSCFVLGCEQFYTDFHRQIGAGSSAKGALLQERIMLKAEQFRQDTKAFWSKMDQIGKVVATDHVGPTSRRQRAATALRPAKPKPKKRKH